MNRDLKPFKLSNEDIAELEYIKKENEFKEIKNSEEIIDLGNGKTITSYKTLENTNQSILDLFKPNIELYNIVKSKLPKKYYDSVEWGGNISREDRIYEEIEIFRKSIRNSDRFVLNIKQIFNENQQKQFKILLELTFFKYFDF
tara:strand:- start:20 stop:451 length:432 start_codon:yes stop_codon:yes gene_type:complete